MANELDKFVLQYTVEMKDAIVRLEKLNQKVDSVNKQTSKTAGEFKHFASGATEELGKVVPGIDKVSAAVKLLGAEFAAASVAVGVLALGIKSVIDMREQYNVQRKTGMETGVSGVRLEEYQRKFVRASSGTVSRDAALEGTRQISDLIGRAYTDPTRQGTENRQLRLLGIDPGARGKGATPLNDAMRQMGARLQGMSPAQVQGVAKSMGLSQDWLLTLQKIGPAIGKITEQSEEEVKARQATGDQYMKFNDSLAQMNEQFTRAENILAQKFLPAFTKFVDVLAGVAKLVPDASANIAKGTSAGRMAPEERKANEDKSPGFMGWLRRSLGIVDATPKKPAEPKPEAAAAAKKEADAIKDKVVDHMDDVNRQGAQTANDMTLAVNMFAGAVASFSNAIDARQAMAAWAGLVGQAAGLGSGPEATGTPEIRSNAGPVGPTKYDSYFNAAAAKTGLDVNLIKRVAGVESQLNPNATSEQGAEGLMQVMPANFKSLGIKNGHDPEQSIMGGSKLLAQYIKEAGGDVRTGLMMYHAGYDRSGWGPRTRAYPGKVLGDGISGNTNQQIRGESREKIQLRSVQQNIANRLGVPLQQIQLGGVNRGDVSFARSQLEGGVQNQIFDLERQLNTVGLPQQAYSKIRTELRDQRSGLAMLQKYGGQSEAVAQEGPRSITIGERAVVINVTGSGNPEEVARHVEERFNSGFSDLINGTHTNLKY